MKSSRVDLKECVVYAVPDSAQERILAPRGTKTLIAFVISVHDVPERLAADIHAGEPGALDECMRPEGNEGYHRLTQGQAYLSQVEGLDPEEIVELTGGWFYETHPEDETS